MTEHGRKLGAAVLSYGTAAAEEMIRDRIKKLERRGYPDARSAAIGKLAAEGNLRTDREVGTHERYLGESMQRELAAKLGAHGRDELDAAKAEAERRGISLSEVMNERAMRGEVAL